MNPESFTTSFSSFLLFSLIVLCSVSLIMCSCFSFLYPVILNVIILNDLLVLKHYYRFGCFVLLFLYISFERKHSFYPSSPSLFSDSAFILKHLFAFDSALNLYLSLFPFTIMSEMMMIVIILFFWFNRNLRYILPSLPQLLIIIIWKKDDDPKSNVCLLLELFHSIPTLISPAIDFQVSSQLWHDLTRKEKCCKTKQEWEKSFKSVA